MIERKEKRAVDYLPVNIYGIDRPYSAISVDYSNNGLGMITNLDLAPGDSLKVSCLDFWPNPRQAMVVWIKPITTAKRRVGLELY